MQATASFRFFGFVRQSDFWEIPQEVGVRDDHPGDIRGLLPDTYTLWRVIFFITIICAANFIVDSKENRREPAYSLTFLMLLSPPFNLRVNYSGSPDF